MAPRQWLGSLVGADEDVRRDLLADAVEFRRLMSATLEGYLVGGTQTVWDHLTGPVDALLENKPIEVPRYKLPDWCGESCRYGGRPYDRFVLGSDDILREL